MVDVINKEPYKAKRLQTGSVSEDPNYVPKRVKTSSFIVSGQPKRSEINSGGHGAQSISYQDKSCLAGKRLSKNCKTRRKVQKGKRIAPKTNLFQKFISKILNNKIIKIIVKSICFVSLGMLLLITKGSSANKKAQMPNTNIPNDSFSLDLDLDSVVESAELVFQNREPEINFDELDASGKVDYLMNEYGFTLDELRDILFALDSKVNEEHRAQMDAKYSQVDKLPEAKYLGDEFVAYGGDIQDLLPKLNVNYIDYKNIIAPTLIKTGGSLNYKEAFALMTLVLNKTLSMEHPNNILDVITAPGGFDAYLSGDYKTVNIEDYPYALDAFKDCLWNFIQDQTIRLHDYTDVMPWEANNEDYKFFFNVLGNHYGNLLTPEKTNYLDIEPFLTYG